MKNTYCVYLHVNKIDGKKYVGQTCQIPEKRWKEGKGYKGCVHFFNAIIKYGWDSFDHLIIADNLSHEEANYLETTLITVLKTTDPEYGYNMTNGGSNKKPSEEAKKHMSEAHLGSKQSEESNKKRSNTLKGRIPWNKGIKIGSCSEEKKQKISRANKGKKPSIVAIKASIEARKGKAAWNKGLNKHNDERVAKYAKSKLKTKQENK